MFANQLVTLALVAMAVVVACAGRSEANSITMDKRPDMDSIPVKNIASEDKTVLANLAGYVEFATSERLLLDVNFVSISEPDEFNTRYVALSDGGSLSFHVAVSKLGSQYNVSSHSVYFHGAHICDFDIGFEVHVPEDKRLSMTEPKAHFCSNEHHYVVATLFVKSFELELDAKPENAERGVFGKEPFQSDRDLWFTMA